MISNSAIEDDLLTDLDFFDQEMARYSESLQETLMNKKSLAGNDLMEELVNVYSEMQVMGQDFKKAINIFSLLMEHSRELYDKNKEMGS